ncbi:MAG: imidazole glycerol phosphate synthase subunit HisH [Nitriliruptoraceae bacterium]
MTLRIAVLDYGAGNVRSARRGFDAAGAVAEVVADPRKARQADALVVPGVGHFSSCLANLRISGLHEVLQAFIVEQRPVFGICVGMQLLYAGSEEGDEPGLALLPGAVVRFPSNAIVPHLGWDTIQVCDDLPSHDGALVEGLDGERLYFTHSYYSVPADESHVLATCRYGGTNFPCVVREGSVVGTQFHPEKSGAIGQRLLTNWLRSAATTSVA